MDSPMPKNGIRPKIVPKNFRIDQSCQMPKSSHVIRKNKPLRPVDPKDVSIIEKAQRRVKRVNKAFPRWRDVQSELGLPNVNIAWKFVNENVVPTNTDLRIKLFLPPVLPSERPPRKPRKIIPKIGSEDWELYYLKSIKPQKRR